MDIDKSSQEEKLKEDDFEIFINNFVDYNSLKKGRGFFPRASDIFISTASKCGTTFISQICNSLRSNGDNSFDDLDEVVPYNIFASICGQDVEADHYHKPRVFKTHDSFNEINKVSFENPGCKYIVVCRDPVSAGLSLYNFMPLMSVRNPAELVEMCWENPPDGPAILASGNWPSIYLSWFNASKIHKNKILWIFYEDLANDTEREVKRILKFMDLGIEPGSEEETSLLKVTLQCSSKDFMLKNVTKFDSHFIYSRRSIALAEAGFQSGVASAQKVKSAKDQSQERKSLSEYVERAWPRKMATTGCNNYEDFKSEVKKLFC